MSILDPDRVTACATLIARAAESSGFTYQEFAAAVHMNERGATHCFSSCPTLGDLEAIRAECDVLCDQKDAARHAQLAAVSDLHNVTGGDA